MLLYTAVSRANENEETYILEGPISKVPFDDIIESGCKRLKIIGTNMTSLSGIEDHLDHLKSISLVENRNIREFPVEIGKLTNLAELTVLDAPWLMNGLMQASKNKSLGRLEKLALMKNSLTSLPPEMKDMADFFPKCVAANAIPRKALYAVNSSLA